MAGSGQLYPGLRSERGLGPGYRLLTGPGRGRLGALRAVWLRGRWCRLGHGCSMSGPRPRRGTAGAEGLGACPSALPWLLVRSAGYSQGILELQARRSSIRSTSPSPAARWTLGLTSTVPGRGRLRPGPWDLSPRGRVGRFAPRARLCTRGQACSRVGAGRRAWTPTARPRVPSVQAPGPPALRGGKCAAGPFPSASSGRTGTLSAASLCLCSSRQVL